MRGRNKKMQRLQRGQTIVAEREHVETESERMLAHKKAHRKQTTTLILVALMVAVLALAGYLGIKELAKTETELIGAGNYQVKAEIVDEDNRGQISSRVRTYIAQLEQDLADLGFTVIKVTLPTGMSRTLYVDVAGEDEYFKVDIDRPTAVVAEDLARVVKYLHENDLHPTYVDVRVEGRAYYL